MYSVNELSEVDPSPTEIFGRRNTAEHMCQRFDGLTKRGRERFLDEQIEVDSVPRDVVRHEKT